LGFSFASFELKRLSIDNIIIILLCHYEWKIIGDGQKQLVRIQSAVTLVTKIGSRPTANFYLVAP